MPIKSLEDFHINYFVKKSDDKPKNDITIISSLAGSTINYKSQSSLMGVVEGPFSEKEKSF